MNRKELMHLIDEYALRVRSNPLAAETMQARRDLREAIDAVVNHQTTTDKHSLTDEELADCGLLSELDD